MDYEVKMKAMIDPMKLKTLKIKAIFHYLKKFFIRQRENCIIYCEGNVKMKKTKNRNKNHRDVGAMFDLGSPFVNFPNESTVPVQMT